MLNVAPLKYLYFTNQYICQSLVNLFIILLINQLMFYKFFFIVQFISWKAPGLGITPDLNLTLTLATAIPTSVLVSPGTAQF